MSEKGKGVSSTPSLNITESKQAEEELARLSEAVRMSADSIVISDMEGKITYVNEATLKMYGTDDPKDLLGKSSFELIAPEDREKAFAGMKEVMERGYAKDREYHVTTKSGSKILTEMSTSLVKSKTEEAIGFVSISRDITERKHAEETLRESEMKYKLLFESSGSAITYFDTEGKCVFLNRRGAKYLGGEAEEFIGKSIYDIFPETANFYVQRFTKIMNEGKGYIFEDSVELPDGKRWFSSNIQPVKDESGTVRGIQIISDDITEHKRAEEELRSSEERLRILFEYAPDAYYLSDLKGNFVDGNKAAEEITGYRREELIGKSFLKLKLLSPRQIPKAAALLAKNALGLSTGPDEFILNWKDGNQVPVEIRTFPVKIKGQTLVLGIARDITERKRAEEALQKKNEQLNAQNEELRATEEELHAANEELRATNEELRDAQEKLVRSERLAAIGQLAGGVGHELRNPLSAIKNAVYYVRGKVAKSELGQKEPQVIEFLDIMDDEINSSSKIINDLLGFSRVGKPTVSPTRIERVIDDALSYTTIPENIELTKKLDTDLLEVKIDTDQVRQVLVNMILNAVQAMPTGGKLTINAKEKDKFLEVEIADTGCGIPQEVMDKIFDPLFTTRAKGIGLGLAVCKAIIDRHAGYIEVKSEVEKGTTFIIKLPLRAE